MRATPFGREDGAKIIPGTTKGITMQGTTWRRGVLAAVGAAILAVSLAVPAQAAPPDPEGPPPGSPLALCEQAATAAQHQQWTCFGGELTVEKDAHGNAVNRTERVAPELPEQAQGTPQAASSKPTFTTASFVKKATVVTGGYDGRSTRIVPMKGGDYDDVWCESGSICTNKISNYISKTKGNAAYGNQNGVIGRYDAVFYTYLNGRQGQWKVKLIWDYGPSIKFYSPAAACRQKDFWQGAISCGYHYFSVDPTINTVTYRWESNTIYGNRLANAADYYGSFRTSFVPAGYGTYTAGHLNGAVFKCPSSGNCYFP